MGYDLSAMSLEPVAGVVREISGRKILVVIYQGEGGSLLCYTFLGSEADAPPNAASFFDPDTKVNFHAFSQCGNQCSPRPRGRRDMHPRFGNAHG